MTKPHIFIFLDLTESQICLVKKKKNHQVTKIKKIKPNPKIKMKKH